jgi:hypothetical protein
MSPATGAGDATVPGATGRLLDVRKLTSEPKVSPKGFAALMPVGGFCFSELLLLMHAS